MRNVLPRLTELRYTKRWKVTSRNLSELSVESQQVRVSRTHMAKVATTLIALALGRLGFVTTHQRKTLPGHGKSDRNERNTPSLPDTTRTNFQQYEDCCYLHLLKSARKSICGGVLTHRRSKNHQTVITRHWMKMRWRYHHARMGQGAQR